MKNLDKESWSAIDLSDQDVIVAMKQIQGYIDISPGDFREVFRLAYTHALRRIMASLKAQDIMTQPAHCVQADMDLIGAATFLADKQFSGAPVVDVTGKIVGVLSEKDFLARMGMEKPSSFMQIVAHCLTHRGCMAMTLRNHFVYEIMSTPPVTAGLEITMGEIASLFVGRQINRLPIIDAEKRPIGIVTRTDLVQSYCQQPLEALR